MFAKHFLLLLLLFSSDYYCQDLDKPMVETPLGQVRGRTKTSFEGKKFSSFEGIPFAKPPIGDRRFGEPEPVEPWYGVWEAIYLTQCVQVHPFKPDSTIGQEDCLHINVYVPGEKPNPEKELDVIVHIHGGGYMIGWGHMYANPELIIDRNVIFVTFNYRLGVFGFLSTEDDVVPGNNGMKDQVMALRWIQQNIASFGGNPNSVTITGGSAGASSVHLHYFSEMSKGLFHRGMSNSGVALNAFSIQEGALKKAKLVGEAIGCPSSPTKILVECLKQKPHEQILKQMSSFARYKILPIAPFAPVVEKGSKPFLKENPYHLLKKGKVLDLPWVASMATHEGYLPMIITPEDLDHINENWESLAPAILDFEYTIDESLKSSTSEKIRKYYFQENKMDATTYDRFVQMLGDRTFLVDAEKAVKLQSKATKSPVYYYHFAYPGDNSDTKFVGHCADSRYYFGTFMDAKPLTPNELKLKDVMLKMLVHYAKTGIPVIEGLDWKPTKHDQLTYLNISSYIPAEMTVTTVEQATPGSFWASLGFAENENLISNKDEL